MAAKLKAHQEFTPAKENAFVPNFSPPEYLKLGRNFPPGDPRRIVSNSDLGEFAKCPQRWNRGVEDEGTKSTEWGSLMDCLVLTRDRFEIDFAVAPETYTTAPKEGTYVLTSLFDGPWNPRTKACQTWKAEQEASGKVVITPEKLAEAQEPKLWNYQATICDEWRTARLAEGKTPVKSEFASSGWKALARLTEDAEIGTFLAACKRQVLVQVDYHDEQTGITVPVKCLIDLMADPENEAFGDMLGDFKTTASADPSSWQRSVFNFGYYKQAALYLDAINVATGLKFEQFAHVVQESAPPYEPARRILSPQFIQLGRAWYRRALVDYCYSLKNNDWPGYDDGWRIVDVEPWMIGKE